MTKKMAEYREEPPPMNDNDDDDNNDNRNDKEDDDLFSPARDVRVRWLEFCHSRVSPRKLKSGCDHAHKRVQSRFAETRFAKTLTLTVTLTLNPNFGKSGFGESGRHRQMIGLVSERQQFRDIVCG